MTLENTTTAPSPQVAGNGAASSMERRVRALQRAFQRLLSAKPTELQRTAIDRAALMTARAEALAADPDAAPADIAKLDNCASRARAAAIAAIGSIPNHPKLIRELRLLERRTSRMGRDVVDHGVHGSDDHANSLAGMLRTLASSVDVSMAWVSGEEDENKDGKQNHAAQMLKAYLFSQFGCLV